MPDQIFSREPPIWNGPLFARLHAGFRGRICKGVGFFMLTIDRLSITHRRDLREILSGFSLLLGPGERAVLIGEEGNGKSTLLRLIHDPASVEDYAEWSGKVSTGGRTGYLPQELDPTQLSRPARELFEASAGFMSLTPKERAALAKELGLPLSCFTAQRPLREFSGGERIKMQLACIAAEQPELYLLDEPSNDLDLDSLEWLEGFILSRREPVLFVSHDETLIERTANVIIHLELLRRKTLPRATVARLPYRDYVEARYRSLARQEQAARKEREEFEAKLARYREIRQKVESAQRGISRQDPHGGRLLKKKMHTVQSMGRRFEKEREALTAMPETEEAIFLSFPSEAAVPNGKRILELALPVLEVDGRVLARDIELRVTGPERICIVGGNGAGKTTLLRRIASELLARRDIRAAYMPQELGERLDTDESPVELLNASGSRAEEERIRAMLGSLRYTSKEMEQPCRALSGGQRAKLLLASMALEGAEVLILDEPTRNLSPLSGPVIRELLRSFRGAVISVSHDRKFIGEVCTAVYELGPDGLCRIS